MKASRSPDLAALAREMGQASNPVIRQGLADLHIREEIKGYIGQRIRSSVAAGRVPGPEGSIAKLNGADLARRTRDMAMSIIGTAGQAWDGMAPSSDAAARWSSVGPSAAGVSIARGTHGVPPHSNWRPVLRLPNDPCHCHGAPLRDISRQTQPTAA